MSNEATTRSFVIDSLKGFYEKLKSSNTFEDSSRKVTTLTLQSTDSQYPSAKCVYDLIGPIDDALDIILNGSN